MSIGMGLIQILILGIIISKLVDLIKRKQMRGLFRATKRKKFVTPLKTLRVLPEKNLLRRYSEKNKECYEHDVKVSSYDEKPKRKKSLWNEPSWDDELYS